MKSTRYRVVALLFATLFSASAAAHTTLVFNVFIPHGHYIWKVFRHWKQDVARVTDGRVTVTFPAANAAPPPDQWNAVRGGLVDGAFIFNSFAPKSVRTLQRFGQLPFISGTNDTEAASVAYWRTYKKFFAGHEKTPNVHVISCFVFGKAQTYSLSRHPITSVADLRDRRMWALPGTATGILKNLHVSFTAGPAVRIVQLASRHVVHGAIGLDPYAMVHFQAAPYIKSETVIPGGISTASFTAFINESKWKRISKADRAAIMRVSGEVLARRVGQMADRGNRQAAMQLAKQGDKMIHASPRFIHRLKTAGAPLTAAWIRKADKLGVNGKAAIAYFKAQAKLVQAHE